MKELLWGIVLIVIAGFGGLVYRNAVEHPLQPIACPLDAEICPDGTSVGRTGNSCTFPACPPPNISLSDIGIAFALPDGFENQSVTDGSIVAAYHSPATASSTNDATIIIRRYAIDASSTALSVIQSTAIGGASGQPVSATSFTSTVLGTHRFTVATVERFEGVVDTSYYLARSSDVLRFDAIDQNVTNWTDPNLDQSKLAAHAALLKLLSTLQGQ
jgi:hypothetical protein